MGKVIILFGVSGCGKSLIGKKLSEDLEFKFVEGDNLHSNENIEKMNNNIPLTISWMIKKYLKLLMSSNLD